MEDFLDFEKAQVFKLEIGEDIADKETIYAKFISAKYKDQFQPCYILVEQILEMDKYFDLKDDYKTVKRKIDCELIQNINYEIRD